MCSFRIAAAVFYTWINDTPVGRLLLAGDDDYLRWLVFDSEKSRQRHGLPKDDWQPNDRPFREAVRQLQAYFAGNLRRFDLPFDGSGTGFQKQVWRALLDVPYGETASYSDIARAVGRPKAFRAVGTANGRNPISIIVPCHRIVGSTGQLTGFGGGLDRKQTLLRHEAGILNSGSSGVS